MELRHKKLFIDDYNESTDVNSIIHRLMENDSPVYVSCLSRPDYFDKGVLNANVYLGLHLYLTDFPLHSFQAYKLNFRDEFCRQLENFREKTGKNPDYIDGHRHIQEYAPISSCIKRICHDSGIPLRRNRPSPSAMKLLVQKRYWRSYLKNMSFHLITDQNDQNVFNAPVASNYSFKDKSAFQLLLQNFLKNEDPESFIFHPGPLGWKRHELEVFRTVI